MKCVKKSDGTVVRVNDQKATEMVAGGSAQFHPKKVEVKPGASKDKGSNKSTERAWVKYE